MSFAEEKLSNIRNGCSEQRVFSCIHLYDKYKDAVIGDENCMHPGIVLDLGNCKAFALIYCSALPAHI
eukprot:scaffold207152_cov20-Prasinocladus_malaysianus.AAC.1